MISGNFDSHLIVPVETGGHGEKHGRFVRLQVLGHGRPVKSGKGKFHGRNCQIHFCKFLVKFLRQNLTFVRNVNRKTEKKPRCGVQYCEVINWIILEILH